MTVLLIRVLTLPNLSIRDPYQMLRVSSGVDSWLGNKGQIRPFLCRHPLSASLLLVSLSLTLPPYTHASTSML